MANTSRIFLVTNHADESLHLVRAQTKVAAQRHVVNDAYETRLANTDDLALLLPKGVVIETAMPEAGHTLV